MSWYVRSEIAFTSVEQKHFIGMVENAVRRHGTDRGSVAGEVRDECQKEWPQSGRAWVVLYDTNEEFGIALGDRDKKIFLSNRKGDHVYAARV